MFPIVSEAPTTASNLYFDFSPGSSKRELRRGVVNILKSYGYYRVFVEGPGFYERSEDEWAKIEPRKGRKKDQFLVRLIHYERDQGGHSVKRLVEDLEAYFAEQRKKGLPKPARFRIGSKKTLPRSEGEGLESRVAVFAISILGGIALSLSSLNATGNAVAGLSGTSQGLGGVFLFVFGLIGLVLNFKK